MPKYHPLWEYLNRQTGEELLLTISEIESIIGAKLPTAALAGDKSWWANRSDDTYHVQAHAWGDSPYCTDEVAHNSVRFVRRKA